MAARNIGRRAVIGMGAAGAAGAALVLTGCTPEASSGTSGASGSSSAAAGTKVAALADVPVGKSISTKIAGKSVIVSQPTAGKVVCLSAVCTHEGCLVNPSGAKLVCPCHGAEFDAVTGAVLKGPTNKPLPGVAVTVTNGDIVTS
jgi:nitrite reductase/ring-hydroxylating ferredoxin subunit